MQSGADARFSRTWRAAKPEKNHENGCLSLFYIFPPFSFAVANRLFPHPPALLSAPLRPTLSFLRAVAPKHAPALAATGPGLAARNVLSFFSRPLFPCARPPAMLSGCLTQAVRGSRGLQRASARGAPQERRDRQATTWWRGEKKRRAGGGSNERLKERWERGCREKRGKGEREGGQRGSGGLGYQREGKRERKGEREEKKSLV